jgi:hypothetical protein
MEVTPFSWPINCSNIFVVYMFHIIIVRSSLPEYILSPIISIAYTHPLWPWYIFISPVYILKALIVGSQPATNIWVSDNYIHLIASLEATKPFTILFWSRSMHLTILSQDAVKSMFNFEDYIPHKIGSANFKIDIHVNVSHSHCLTVQSFDIEMILLCGAEIIWFIRFVWPIKGVKLF